jgi:phosphate transport system substrate-binding protein
LGIGCLALAACAAPTPTAPIEAPERVGVSVGTQEIAIGWLIQYRDEVGVPAFDLEPMTVAQGLESAEQGEISVLISASPPPEGWFGTPITREALAVAVHLDGAVNDLSLAQLAEVFSGGVATWNDLGGPPQDIDLFYPFPEEDLGRAFDAAVLHGLHPAGYAHLMPHARATLTELAQAPYGIGILPYSALDNRVRAIRVEGVLPGPTTIAEGRYPILLTLYAAAPEEPQGAVREWLAWLQARLPEP